MTAALLCRYSFVVVVGCLHDATTHHAKEWAWQDAFVSSIASVLGIDVNRIAIVDVVPGNARRRRLLGAAPSLLGIGARRLLQGDGASVDLEILPSAEVSVEGGTVAEDNGVANVTVTRSANIYRGVSVSFAAMVGNGSTAVDGVHFTSLSTLVTFAPYEVTKLVEVPILSVPGYFSVSDPEATEVTFAVMISDAQNATISTSKATIAVKNVHPPAPSSPTFVSKTATTIRVAWSAPVWPTPPTDMDWSTVLEYQVEQGRVQNSTQHVVSWAVAQSQVTGAATELDVTGLEVSQPKIVVS